jgi:toxin-antitoxin system PIN domain toxin
LILVDTNLLLYAYLRDYDEHDAARTWLEKQLTQSARVGLSWHALLSFVRLATNPRVYPDPVPIADAWSQVESWLSADSAWIPAAGDRHQAILGTCMRVPGLRANEVPDAHLAALAIENGLTLMTNDVGFARFPDLSWSNPLQQES